MFCLRYFLLQVIWKYFYSSQSVREHATLCQLRNLINRTNVSSKTKGNFNSCDDFLVLVITCHVLAAAMEYLDMKSLDDTPAEHVVPNASEVWMQTTEKRKDILESICAGIVNRHIPFQYHGATTPSIDQVYEYGRQFLSIGCLYLEFADGIREGDGTRVYRCWKYFLPIFKGSNRTNYSIEALTLLNQCEFKLTPRQSAELKWSRFINCHGVQGRNIPCDLHLEHMNRLCKEAVYGLQANKTPDAIVRVGKSLGMLKDVIEQFDEDNNVPLLSGAHTAPSMKKDRDIILQELLSSEVFSVGIVARNHASFPRVKVWLRSFDHKALLSWMIDHMS